MDVPKIRAPPQGRNGPRKPGGAANNLSGPGVLIPPKDQWPLPPGAARRSLAVPQRPERPDSHDILNPAIHRDRESRASTQTSTLQLRPQSNRLTVPDPDALKLSVPNPTRPITTASVASTSSRYSTAEEASRNIPEFPSELADSLQQDQRYSQQLQQQQQQQQRNRPPLGPPPSARRGPASYYSQHVQVDPIEEEESAQSATRTSFASSNNRASTQVPDYYASSAAGTPTWRQASHDSETLPRLAHQPVPDRSLKPSVIAATTAAASAASDTQKRLSLRKPVAPRSPNPIAHIQIKSPKKELGTITTQTITAPRARAYDTSGPRYGDPRVESILARLEKGGALSSPNGSDESPSPTSSVEQSPLESHGRGSPTAIVEPSPLRQLGTQSVDYPDTRPATQAIGSSNSQAYPDTRPATQAIGSRRSQVYPDTRPATQAIGIGSLQDYPSTRPPTQGPAGRGASMASLPSIIFKATTLAPQRDKNKIASRAVSVWPDSGVEKRGVGWQRQSAHSDAFPPPPSVFPAEHPRIRPNPKRGSARWLWRKSQSVTVAKLRAGRIRMDAKPQPKGKRICGLSARLFFLILILVLLLLVAAILLPIILVVLPKEAATRATVVGCMKTHPCQNGGTILAEGAVCQCLCVNGYTGDVCSTAPTANCDGLNVTITQNTTTQNATIGDGLPRLFAAAPTYNLTLNASTILGLFATTNLSCASENALITFNGLMARSIYELPTPVIGKRQVTNTVDLSDIVFGTTAASTKESSSGTTEIGEIASPPGLLNGTKSLDIARLAVLFVLQDSNELNFAIAAQLSLQKYFVSGETAISALGAAPTIVSTTGMVATNVTVGNGYSVNLNTGLMVNSNGTWFGNVSDGASTTSTSTTSTSTSGKNQKRTMYIRIP